MGQIQALRAQAHDSKKTADHTAQLEAVRKMLLAMVQDVRVVLLKLADQTQTLRYIAGRGDAAARAAAARDTFELFAPLANRLGVWQLKWELEDLAFRCSDPDTYKRIARELDEKRVDREQFIADVIDVLRAELDKAGIKAEVNGRPKHIYSIYRKLTRKDRSLNELFDIRGVRVLVEDIKDCYAVLGLVHHLWTPLPGSSTTTSPSRSRTTIVRCTPRWSDRIRKCWRCRSAPTRCTSIRSSASPRTGATRRAAARAADAGSIQRARSPGCGRFSTGRRGWPTSRTSPNTSAPGCSRTASMC